MVLAGLPVWLQEKQDVHIPDPARPLEHTFGHVTCHSHRNVMTAGEKVQENKARRVARRRGFTVERCRRRDPKALGFGRYRIVEKRTYQVVAGGEPSGYSMTLAEVEAWLENATNHRR